MTDAEMVTREYNCGDCPAGECRKGYGLAKAFCYGCGHLMAVVFPACLDESKIGGCDVCDSARGIVRILTADEVSA